MTAKGFTPATLKLLVRMFVAVLNDVPKGDHISSPFAMRDLFAADFRVSSSAGLPCVTGRDHFLQGCELIRSGFPHFHVDIIDMVVEVEDADAGNGKVWVYSKITGLSGEQELLSLDMLKWKQGLCTESCYMDRSL